MAAFTHTYGKFAAVGSFNKWLESSLALTLPAWMESCPVNFDYPRQPLTFPSFSVSELGGRNTERAMGRVLDRDATTGKHYAGNRAEVVLEVSAWVTKDANPDWAMHLRVMRDMLLKLLITNYSVPINDLYTSTDSPTATGAVVRVESCEEQVAPPDPNPDVARARFVVRISWAEKYLPA